MRLSLLLDGSPTQLPLFRLPPFHPPIANTYGNAGVEHRGRLSNTLSMTKLSTITAKLTQKEKK
jgi:hypothetical protein